MHRVIVRFFQAIGLGFTFIFLPTLSFARNGTVELRTFNSASMQNKPVSVYVYLPPNYSTTADPYRLYIFLHGAGGSNALWHITDLQVMLDYLLGAKKIDPLIAVCPQLDLPVINGTNFLNIHEYTDSERNGNFRSVITVDLLEWLAAHYNVASVREKRAIGGFSMGADGSARIALTNCDKFAAFVAHDGIMSIKLLRAFIPELLNEYPQGPPYNFYPNNSLINSLMWFGFASCWSPNLTNPNMPEWNLDFPIDNQGKIVPEIFNKWVTNQDPITLIRNPEIYKYPVAMYFDTHTCPPDVPYTSAYASNKLCTDRFHLELDSLGIAHTYKINDDKLCHSVYPSNYRDGLYFLDEAFDALTKVEEHSSPLTTVCQFRLEQNFPNPFNAVTTISFELNKDCHVQLIVRDLLGKEVKTLVEDDLSSGEHHLIWDASGQPSGLYFYTIRVMGNTLTRKIILTK
jgi:hypothetical protein